MQCSFECRNKQSAVQKLVITDIAFWESIIADGVIEVIYIESNPSQYNMPSHFLKNRCKVCTNVLVSTMLSILLFFSVWIISISICHYKMDEILLIMFMYPGIMLILGALCYLCWPWNERKGSSKCKVHDSLLPSNDVKV